MTDTVEIEPVIDVSICSNYREMLRTTAGVLKSLGSKFLLSLKVKPNVYDVKEAVLRWNRQAKLHCLMTGLRDSETRNPCSCQGNVHSQNIIETTFNSSDHAGVESTLTKIQSKLWIPGVRCYVKSLRSRQ